MLLAWAVFIVGVVAPAIVAGYRVIIGSLRNAPLFGQPPSGASANSDPVLWVTAVLCTAAVGILAALVLIEAVRGRLLVSGLLLGLAAAALAALNWYTLLG